MHKNIKRIIKWRFLSIPIIGQKISECYVVFVVLKRLLKGGSKKIKETIQLYRPEVFDDRKAVLLLQIQIIVNSLVYKTDLDEYFLLGFSGLSGTEKRKFVGNAEGHVLRMRCSTEESAALLNDKYRCYKVFREYYERDAVSVASECDFEIFREFCNTHTEYMVKPLNGFSGDGIFMADHYVGSHDVVSEFNRVLAVAPCIVEEKVVSDPAIARFHPQSLNTVRYATCFSGNTVIPLFAFIRFGTGDGIVDNLYNNGILAAVDAETGFVKSDAVDVLGHEYPVHPNTGYRIRGFQIPRWQELVSLAETVAKIIPDQKYVGWDFALKDNSGWILIEANPDGQFCYQYSAHEGIRPLTDKYMR